MVAAAQKNCDSEPASLGRAIDENDHELPIFQLEVIMAATDSFSEENKLGQGGYGPVYKVTNHLFPSLTLCIYVPGMDRITTSICSLLLVLYTENTGSEAQFKGICYKQGPTA